jgi:hypothetical protein
MRRSFVVKPGARVEKRESAGIGLAIAIPAPNKARHKAREFEAAKRTERNTKWPNGTITKFLVF